MSVSTFIRFVSTAFIVLVSVASPISVQAQQRGGTPQTDKVAPVNSGANPYRVIRDWAQFTSDGRPWGGSNGVAIDRDGKTVWAVDRCSPGTAPGCLGSKGNPVHHFDESGKEIRSFGAGMFVWPHGIHVDRDGNVWVADSRAPGAEELTKFPGEDKKGSVVVKFSPEGKVLMTLGKPGVRGTPPEALTDPTDVVTDPGNGDVYVAESHTDVADPNLIGRISVFDRSGKFLRTIGKTGTGPGEFRTPHAVEFDSRGRLIVADRHNHRVQILTKDGKFISEYDNFGRSSGLAIDKDDTIYTADSESTERVHPGWQRGIRIGSLTDGKVTIFVPPHMTPNSTDGAMGEGIAIDAAGNVFTAEAQLRGVTKYVRSAAAAVDDQEGRPVVEARGSVVPVPLPPGGPPPRLSDGHVDLSGVWFAGPTGNANAWSVVPDRNVPQDPIPFQPWAAAKVKAMTPTERQINNPAIACLPVGTPGMFTQNHGYPSQIAMFPGLFIHLAEADNSWRVVHTDGRPHLPADQLEPLYNGDQTAHWEGDTLVIDTISIDERTWINSNGWFHSDQVHVIERLRRPSRNYMEYQYTVEDPKVLTKPWTSAWDQYSLSKGDLIENFCTNNENIDELKKLRELERAKSK